MRTFFLLLLLCCLPLSVTVSAATLASDGTGADVAAKWASAVDGDEVTMPVGTNTYTSGLTLSGKGVKLRGAGSGRIIGSSLTSIAVGTGTKVFTVEAGLSVTAGQALRIWWVGESSGFPGSMPDHRATFMHGTVTTYSGTTLTMNITTTGGSGTKADWLVGTEAAQTVIINNSSGTLFTVVEDASHNVEICDFKIAAGSSSSDIVRLSGSGKPIMIRDCWIEQTEDNPVAIHSFTPRGWFWDLSIDCSPFAASGYAFHHQPDSETGSWGTASTMGAADTTYLKNTYFEDCDFHNFLHMADFDNNSRAVVRYSLLHDCGWVAHGCDTSDYGVRHLEFYNVEFRKKVDGDGYPLNHWGLLRGGTMVVTDCAIPNLRVSDGVPEFRLWIVTLGESESGCWGASTPGIQYPAPRQVGYGRITGTGVDGLGNSTFNGVYVGDLEPIYIWNNTGIATPAITVDDTGDGGCGGTPDDGADYVQQDREWYRNNGAKPGYAKLSYPGPFRTDLSSPANPVAARVGPGRSKSR